MTIATTVVLCIIWQYSVIYTVHAHAYIVKMFAILTLHAVNVEILPMQP